MLKETAVAFTSPLNQALLILAIAMICLWRKPENKNGVKITVALAALWLFLCSQYFFSYRLIAPLESYASVKTTSELDSENNSAIFVLASYYYDAENQVQVRQFSNSGIQRLVHAHLLHQKLGVPIIVTGGAFNDESELRYADQAKDFLMALGVDSDMIIPLPQGNNTRSEVCALYTLSQSLEHNFQHFEVVSSATHAYRIERLMKQAELTHFRIHPVDQHNIQGFGFQIYWPNLRNLERSQAAFYEYLAILKMHVENAFKLKPTCSSNQTSTS